jgi:hypothetical protein
VEIQGRQLLETILLLLLLLLLLLPLGACPHLLNGPACIAPSVPADDGSQARNTRPALNFTIAFHMIEVCTEARRTMRLNRLIRIIELLMTVLVCESQQLASQSMYYTHGRGVSPPVSTYSKSCPEQTKVLSRQTCG